MKEKDALKSFVQENLEAFNDAEVPGHAWKAIEQKIDKKKQSRTIRLYKIISIAAIGLLLISVGMLLGSRMNNGFQNAEMAAYEKQEEYYSSQVNQKLQDLNKYDSDPGVQSDLKQLDDVYQELKLELLNGDNPNQHVIIDAMLINYQTKVAILERVLESLKESNQLKEENENDEM